jgi:hypothetical protein
VCCIDELDKISCDHHALLEAMEQQSVSIAKVNTRHLLYLQLFLFKVPAACEIHVPRNNVYFFGIWVVLYASRVASLHLSKVDVLSSQLQIQLAATITEGKR